MSCFGSLFFWKKCRYGNEKIIDSYYYKRSGFDNWDGSVYHVRI